MTPKELEDSLRAGGTCRDKVYIDSYPINKTLLAYCDYSLNCKRYGLKQVFNLEQFLVLHTENPKAPGEGIDNS